MQYHTYIIFFHFLFDASNIKGAGEPWPIQHGFSAKNDKRHQG